jgi:class 3 adenylate cyclase
MIDKYVGHCIMAFWNVSELEDDHIANACRTALQAAAASRQLSDKWPNLGGAHFKMGIALLPKPGRRFLPQPYPPHARRFS